MAGLSPFIVITNIFITEFSENSVKTFRENSIVAETILDCSYSMACDGVRDVICKQECISVGYVPAVHGPGGGGCCGLEINPKKINNKKKIKKKKWGGTPLKFFGGHPP